MFIVGGGEPKVGFVAWIRETCDKKLERMSLESHFKKAGSCCSKN